MSAIDSTFKSSLVQVSALLATWFAGSLALFFIVRILTRMVASGGKKKLFHVSWTSARERTKLFVDSPHEWVTHQVWKHQYEVCCVCHQSMLLSEEPILACGICGIACHSQCREDLPEKIANDCKRVALSSDGALTMRPGWLVSQSSFEQIRDALGASASGSGNSVIPKTSSFGSMNYLNGGRSRSSFALDAAAESSAAAGPRKARPSESTAGQGKDADGTQQQQQQQQGRGRDRGGLYRMHHHWVSAPESSEDGPDDKAAGPARCVLCRQPCKTALLAPEPLCRCLWCQGVAHADCVSASQQNAVQRLAGNVRGGQRRTPSADFPENTHRKWCMLGPYRHMVVPPTLVRRIRQPQPPQAAASTRAGGAAGAGASAGAAGGGIGGKQQSSARAAARELATFASRAAQGIQPLDAWPQGKAMVSSAFQKLRRRARKRLKNANGSDLSRQGEHGSSSTEDVPGAANGSGAPSGSSRAESSARAGSPNPPPPRVPPAQMYEIMRLPAESRPVLCFVNTRSGPQGGGVLLSRLRQVLNPLQVWELPGDWKGPEAALTLFARVPRLRIVICGGDGTVGWVLQALDEVWEKLGLGTENPKPPVAMMPLGTGNDLARCFQWASSEFWGLEKGQPDIDRFLRDVDKASVALLDRWSLSLAPAATHVGGGVSVGGGGVAIKRIINNYFSLGSDAKVTLDVHSTREAHPDWFQSQAGNKLWYVSAGAGEFIARSSKGISSQIQIECDGRVLQLPAELEGVVVLNINSFMGGVELWKSGSHRGANKSNKNLETILSDDSELASSSSESDSDGDGDYGRFTPQQTHDGLLEVVGHYGSFHLGKLHIGIGRALQLAQCSRIKITTKEGAPVSMQVDGEPWLQEQPCCLTIERVNQALLLRRSKGEANAMGAVTEVLDRAASEGIISAEQHIALVSEIARALPS